MDKKTLKNLLDANLYKIPDYQRGYAWEEKQWEDFIQDIDALVDDNINNHYTGTIVVYQPKEQNKKKINKYGANRLELVDIVDGQQRLTTSFIYLSIILRKLKSMGKPEFEENWALMYNGSNSRLTLNNDTKDYFFDMISKGSSNTEPITVHQKRLSDVFCHFQTHIDKQVDIRGDDAIKYLEDLCDALIRKLNFSFYSIEEECEIGMTFELMNSRGKSLSILEQVKNYLMYWVSRNESNEGEREDITKIINKNWKDIYTNIGTSGGNEDQCLRIAWTIFCHYTPKNWKGYDGFKAKEYIPIRDFSIVSKDQTKRFIKTFSDGLSEISKHYAIVINPRKDNTLSNDEFVWLSKIHNSGNIANFLPLLISSRIQQTKGNIEHNNKYIELLKALELYIYRVFLYESKRANVGISFFYKSGNELYKSSDKIDEIRSGIIALIEHYSKQDIFVGNMDNPSDWYYNRRLLKYTLFEYELYLLKEEGTDLPPKLEWKDLSDSTIEHILPQTPKDRSHWKQVWNDEDLKKYLHDIGNLVLTENNSNYRNFEFERKKGKPGQGKCYANSDIREERQISKYGDWTPKELSERRLEIISWIKQRWGVENFDLSVIESTLDDDVGDEY